MNPSLRSLPKQLKELFDRLSSSQKASLIGFSLLALISVVVLLSWANRPQYTILFTDLASGDAAKIRDALNDEKIPYRLESGGTTILVPKNRVYDLRLQMASEGIPAQPGIGYELFDRTNLGMSDFVQKLNYRRALEGELSRTIMSIAEVEKARVHLVIPEAALFRDDQKQPTASVVLKFKGRTRLLEEQVRGIATLVARSVEGLDPDNVTILDAFGNLLSGMKTADAGIGLTATQMDLQHKVESYLAAKAQTMLDGVLSPGRSIVRVTAELDFQQIERTNEIYDPESAVIRSEERMQAQSNDVEAPASKEENTLTNYEINKSVEHLVNTGGTIKRLSAAVILDGIHQEGSDGKMEYTPRSPQEMTALTSIVRGALGLREDRGDVLEITNLAFDKESFTEQAEAWNVAEKKDLLMALLPKVILGAVLVVLLIMIRGFLKHNLRVTKSILASGPFSLPAGGAIPAQLMPAYASAGKLPGKAFMKPPPLDEDISDHAREMAARKEQISDFAKNKPEVATTLLKMWLTEK